MEARGSQIRDRNDSAIASEFRDDIEIKRLHTTDEGEI